MLQRIMPKISSVAVSTLGLPSDGMVCPLSAAARSAGINLFDAGIVDTPASFTTLESIRIPYPTEQEPIYALCQPPAEISLDLEAWVSWLGEIRKKTNGWAQVFLSLGSLKLERLKELKNRGILNFLCHAKTERAIVALGFFHFGDSEDLTYILDAYENFDFCGIAHNYLHDAGKTLTVAGDRALGVLVYSPFASGKLVSVNDTTRTAFASYGKPRMASEWALRFALDRQEVLCVLPGCTAEMHLWENVATASCVLPNSLTQKEQKILETAKELIAASG